MEITIVTMDSSERRRVAIHSQRTCDSPRTSASRGGQVIATTRETIPGNEKGSLEEVLLSAEITKPLVNGQRLKGQMAEWARTKRAPRATISADHLILPTFFQIQTSERHFDSLRAISYALPYGCFWL